VTDSANVQLVRSIRAAWERGNFRSSEWAHPEIEYVIADGPSPGSWRGLAGMAEGWREFLGAWEEVRAEAEEYRELDNERVLVLTRYHGRGKRSGLGLDKLHAGGAGLYELHDGKVTRMVQYLDRDRALADLGLAPDTAAADRLLTGAGSDTVDSQEGRYLIRANLDLVRSIYAAWERGDYSSADWANPQVEFVRPDGPSPGKWAGLVGMAEGTRDWLNSWEDHRVEADEYRELDAERVLVLVRVTGRGKASGLEIGQFEPKGAQLFHVRDGKVTRFVHWLSRERAFADLGLASEGDSP
jgi:ketosteroid isomerase-like protein